VDDPVKLPGDRSMLAFAFLENASFYFLFMSERWTMLLSLDLAAATCYHQFVTTLTFTDHI
jgi:hypothetical protein